MSLRNPKSPPHPPPHWAIDLNSPAPGKAKNVASIPDPPGYTSAKPGTGKQACRRGSIRVQRLTEQEQKTTSPVVRRSPTERETDTLKLKKSWEIALAPAKQLPMQAIMSYMAGNSLQIFSIMMLLQLFQGPIRGIMSVNAIFSRLESDGIKGRMLQAKIVYILMQCSLLALGVWKINAMGLLPTTRSDWLAWETERQPLERAYFAFS